METQWEREGRTTMRPVAIAWGSCCRSGGLHTHLWANGLLGRIVEVTHVTQDIPRPIVALPSGQRISRKPEKVTPIPEEGPLSELQPPHWSLTDSHLLRTRQAWLVEGLTRPRSPPNPAWERRVC